MLEVNGPLDSVLYITQQYENDGSQVLLRIYVSGALLSSFRALIQFSRQSSGECNFIVIYAFLYLGKVRYGRLNGFIKVHRSGSLGPQLVGGKQVHLTFRDHILKPSLQRKSTYLSGRVQVTLVFNLLLSSEECCIFHRKSTASIFPLNIYIFSWISHTYVNPSKVPWKLASRSQE